MGLARAELIGSRGLSELSAGDSFRPASSSPHAGLYRRFGDKASAISNKVSAVGSGTATTSVHPEFESYIASRYCPADKVVSIMRPSAIQEFNKSATSPATNSDTPLVSSTEAWLMLKTDADTASPTDDSLFKYLSTSLTLPMSPPPNCDGAYNRKFVPWPPRSLDRTDDP